MGMRCIVLALLTIDLFVPPAIAQPVQRYGDWQQDAPGVVHRITPADLPAPYASRFASNGPHVVPRPQGAMPAVPAGFTAQIFASGLNTPRTIRAAPNGDIFVAETGAERVRVFRPGPDPSRAPQSSVFASGLTLPYGIAFYPPGPDPKYLYLAETNRLLRYPYHTGDLSAAGSAETVLADLPDGGHWTRDVVVAPDGRHLFVSVGSLSNVADGLGPLSPTALASWETQQGQGAAWGSEAGRADVLVLEPDGTGRRIYATGLRNCSGEAISPSGTLWCATNERDGLGDDLPPDYVTSVREGGFYGWPWFYIGDHQDPRHPEQRPDLRDKVTIPDVLLQPHSAPLGITFYTGSMFPADYRGDAFVALHGSWNRALRTGYKVVRIRFADGRPTGSYEDFLTGFVTREGNVWGRPVGVGVAKDGALLVSEDANGTIWRISRENPR
jgi:glucose/arabinose dehydrogenase